MLRKQRSRGSSTLSLLVAAMMTLLLVVTPMVAGAEEAQPPRQTVIISNTVRVDDLAEVEGDEEGAPEEQEEPEGNTRVSIEWLEDSTYAPDTLIAIIGGSGQPITVDLTRGNGWATSLDIDQATMSYYTLLGAQSYTVDAAEGEITFIVADAFENPNAEEEVEEEAEEELEEITETEMITETSETELNIGFSVARNGKTIVHELMGIIPGDVVTFSGSAQEVATPEGATVYLQWQYSDGGEWISIEGAHSDTYQIVYSDEYMNRSYRLVMIIEEQIVVETVVALDDAEDPDQMMFEDAQAVEGSEI